MTHAESAYARADRAVARYIQLLHGSLSPAQRRAARLALIRAVWRRAAALAQLEAMECEGVAA